MRVGILSKREGALFDGDLRGEGVVFPDSGVSMRAKPNP